VTQVQPAIPGAEVAHAGVDENRTFDLFRVPGRPRDRDHRAQRHREQMNRRRDSSLAQHSAARLHDRLNVRRAALATSGATSREVDAEDGGRTDSRAECVGERTPVPGLACPSAQQDPGGHRALRAPYQRCKAAAVSASRRAACGSHRSQLAAARPARLARDRFERASAIATPAQHEQPGQAGGLRSTSAGPIKSPPTSHARTKASRSALIVAASVVGMPCGKPL